ncbi:MAG: RNA-binding S4 domain-containing protein [Rhizobiaceae bacterium]|nr:RNA-binding S4 domain-containing protein [Rhizobiaceae bacterium]
MGEKTIRLDKWLWFARVVKTRTLAQKLVRTGKIRINKEKSSSAAKPVKSGDVLTISLERRILVLRITDCGKRRGPFSEACKLYEDLTPAVEIDESKPAGTRGRYHSEKVPRPDKLGRRKLLQLKNRQYFQ